MCVARKGPKRGRAQPKQRNYSWLRAALLNPEELLLIDAPQRIARDVGESSPVRPRRAQRHAKCRQVSSEFRSSRRRHRHLLAPLRGSRRRLLVRRWTTSNRKRFAYTAHTAASSDGSSATECSSRVEEVRPRVVHRQRHGAGRSREPTSIAKVRSNRRTSGAAMPKWTYLVSRLRTHQMWRWFGSARHGYLRCTERASLRTHKRPRNSHALAHTTRVLRSVSRVQSTRLPTTRP